MRKATYFQMKQLLETGLRDMAMLAGDIASPSGVSWQDIAGTCATNFEVLAMQLHEARRGNHEAALVFPSPAETIEGIE